MIMDFNKLNHANLKSVKIVKWKQPLDDGLVVEMTVKLSCGMVFINDEQDKGNQLIMGDLRDTEDKSQRKFLEDIVCNFLGDKRYGLANSLLYYMHGPPKSLKNGVLNLKRRYKTCMTCGQKAKYLCKCGQVKLCSRRCHKIMWKQQGHKKYCTKKKK